MSQDRLQVGQVVRAKAGRDKGKLFLVVARDEAPYVRIADGAARRLDKPKRKKEKHLEPTQEYISNLAEKLNTGVRVFDSELRKSLNALKSACTDAPPDEEG